MHTTGRGIRAWWWPNNEQPAEVEALIQTVARGLQGEEQELRDGRADGTRPAGRRRSPRNQADSPRPRVVIPRPRCPRQPCTKKAPDATEPRG